MLYTMYPKLQQPLKPSVFGIIFIYHYIQISANIWLSNYVGQPLNFRSDHTSEATIFAYAGLIFLFAPVIFYQNKLPDISIEILRKHAYRYSTKKTLVLYAIFAFIATSLSAVALSISGFSQFIFSFINIKWGLFLLLGFQVILKKEYKWQFIALCLFEFLSGFISYFSDFKTSLIFIAALLIVFVQRINVRQVSMAFLSLVILSWVAVKWTAIKGEYREFLNQGSKSQTVSVSSEEALAKVLELSSKNFDEKEMDPVYELLDRIQYTHHLAKTMDRVPSVIPYTNGSNWMEILEFVFTPRVLNPDKPRLEATKKTTKYTGIIYAGYEQGASFSLGYFVDGYIDFGYLGMWLPLIIIGYIYGSSYYYFLKKSSDNLLFNYSVVIAMFMELITFEQDATYLVGRLASNLIIFYLCIHFVFPFLQNQIRK